MFLIILQIMAGLLLSSLIMIQAKGTGLSRSFGSSMYHSRRGLETLVFRSTIVLTVIFVAVSLAKLFV